MQLAKILTMHILLYSLFTLYYWDVNGCTSSSPPWIWTEDSKISC